jgi:hypothetical protein
MKVALLCLLLAGFIYLNSSHESYHPSSPSYTQDYYNELDVPAIGYYCTNVPSTKTWYLKPPIGTTDWYLEFVSTNPGVGETEALMVLPLGYDDSHFFYPGGSSPITTTLHITTPPYTGSLPVQVEFYVMTRECPSFKLSTTVPFKIWNTRIYVGY